MERQVIADVIQSPDMMGDVLPLIHKDFFTNTERCGIWELLTDHYNKGLSFDMQTITAEIGKPFIDEILPHLSDAGGSISVIQHTSLLRTGAARRRAYCASLDFLQNAVNPKTTEEDILSSIEGFSRRPSKNRARPSASQRVSISWTNTLTKVSSPASLSFSPPALLLARRPSCSRWQRLPLSPTTPCFYSPLK